MLRYLLEKEFKQILRDRTMLSLIMAYPLMILLILPWATTMEVRDVKMQIEDYDQSAQSRRLAETMSASGYFLEAGSAADPSVSEAAISDGTADLVVVIPAGWSRSLLSGSPKEILLSVNTINATKGALGSSYAVSILQGFGEILRQESGFIEPVSIEIREQYLYNPQGSYQAFIVPGLIAVLITLVCCFLPAQSIVDEKSRGTIEQINVTPISKIEFLFAKIIPYWIIGILMLAVSLLIEGFVYGVWPLGGWESILGVFLYMILFIAICSGLGMMIANVSSTLQQTMFMIFFVMIIFMLMSGLFTPIGGMPKWARVFANFLPMTPLITAMRAFILKGSPISSLLPELYSLIAFSFLTLTLSIVTYRKRS